MADKTIILMIAISSIVTFLLRFLPFMIFKGKQTPVVIQYLGEVLPYSIMAMLVVYCLKDIDLLHSPFGAKEIIASLITAVSYLYKRNTLLSVVGGTIIYMLLIQLF